MRKRGAPYKYGNKGFRLGITVPVEVKNIMDLNAPRRTDGKPDYSAYVSTCVKEHQRNTDEESKHDSIDTIDALLPFWKDFKHRLRTLITSYKARGPPKHWHYWSTTPVKYFSDYNIEVTQGFLVRNWYKIEQRYKESNP